MTLRPLMMAMLAVGLALPASAQQRSTMSQEEARQAADAVATKWADTYNKGDASGIAGIFTEDGTFVTPGGPVLSGRQAIEKSIADRMKLGWTQETVKVRDAHPVGDAVWAIGEYTLIGSGQNGGKQISGPWVEVLTRDGGTWHMRVLMASTAPPPPAEATGTSMPPSTTGTTK
ncbi:MAG: nuclear transport factor 2 [Rhodospirillales bacterium]|jgi:uncharacterized protein (TIGR02246 family)|nr:nuclear transport factor 2 [Rhodospirillales bacterium]